MEKIKNYYRATDYFAFFFPLYLIIGIFEFLFEKYSISYFASGIKISAKK